MNVQNKADKSKFAGNMLMSRITMPMPNRDIRNTKKNTSTNTFNVFTWLIFFPLFCCELSHVCASVTLWAIVFFSF